MQRKNDVLFSRLFSHTVTLVGDAVTRPLRHSRHQVLGHTVESCATSILPFHRLIGGGGMCHLVGPAMQDRLEIFGWFDIRAVP